MRAMTTADGYKVRPAKMIQSSPWSGIMLGNLNRDWAFGSHLKNILDGFSYNEYKKWHCLDDNREEPPNTNMYSVAMCLESTIIPNLDDCACGSHAYVSTIIHVGTDQSFGEALEARVSELVWEDLATNWDY